MPGGKALLFTVWKGPGWDEKEIQIQLLETGERRVLVQGGDTGRYVPTGHIVYVQEDKLVAVPFDLQRLDVTATAPVTLAEGVWASEGAHYGISETGLLAYVPALARQRERQLVWVNRAGKAEPLSGPPRAYLVPRLSPDGRQVAVAIDGPTDEVWIYDLERATLSRLTSEQGSSQYPLWTPDGKRLAYRGTRAGFRNLFWKPADGSGAEEQLTTSEQFETPSSWSPDGKVLAFTRTNPETSNDLWVLHLEGERKPQPFLQTRFSEQGPNFSPDGRWIAYFSDASGRSEIYVQPYPGPGGKWQISTEGGTSPAWAQNGRELFYANGNKLMAVEVKTEPTFTASSPHVVFDRLPEGLVGRNWDVSPDGQRFLVVQPVEPEQEPTQINVVLNWFEELKKKVPLKQ